MSAQEIANELNNLLFEKYFLNYEDSIEVARELLSMLEEEKA